MLERGRWRWTVGEEAKEGIRYSLLNKQNRDEKRMEPSELMERL